MTMPEFSLCRHCKADGEWRYSRATVLSNNNVKRHIATRASQAPQDGSQQAIPRWRPVDALMGELGHESLAVTQICLADVKMEETKKAVADADFRSEASFGEWHEWRLGHRPPGLEISVRNITCH